MVLRLEEESYLRADKAISIHRRTSVDSASQLARRFTITAVGTNLSSALPQEYQQADDTANVDVVDFAARPAPVFNDHMADGPPRSSGRMPPTIPPSRRPFSWHRSTSKTSSSSGISPFEEHKQPHWPLPSHESTAVGQSLQEVDPIQNRVVSPPPPAQRSLSKTLRRSSSALRGTPSKSTLTPQRILRHLSSSSSDLGFNVPTPTIKPPPPVTLREPYHFVTLSRLEENVRRRPSGKVEPDIERYISALADTDNRRDNPRYGSRDRLFIREEEEEEEEEEKERLGMNPREYPVRRSTQTDRSSWF